MPDDCENVKLRIAINYFIGLFCNQLHTALFSYIEYYLFDVSNVRYQISGTAIGTKFAPPYACIYMDYMENQFLKNEQIQPWIWFRYIDDIFFIWTASEKELDDFLERLNNFHPNLKFAVSILERKSISLMLLLELIMVNLSLISTANLLMAINTFTLSHVTIVTQNFQLFLVRL